MVTRKATIDTVLFTGNLPIEVASQWKKVIKESALGWKPAVQNGRPVDTPMIFPFFFDTSSMAENCPNYPKDGRLVYYSWLSDMLLALFKDGQEMIPAKNGYLIRPVLVESMR